MVEQRWETIPVTPEHTVVAMCWKHPEQAWPIASEHLTGDSFKDTHCRVLWDAMAACVRNHEPIDVVTVGMRIPPATFRSMGGPQQVWQWVQHNTAPWIRTAFEHHLKKVVDAAKRRHCKAALEKALYVLQEAEDGCISQVQSIVADATMESIRTGLVPYQKIVADTAARLEDMARAGNPPAIPLGIRAFDERFALVPTEPDLVIIAGRPGWGKSALKQQIAEAHAKDGPTLMFELEMGAQQSALRMEAERARLAVGFERKQDVSLVHAQKLARSVGFAETLQLWMDDTPSQTIESVTAAALAHQMKHGKLSAVFVDYIGLMRQTDKKWDRRRHIGHVSRNAKLLAKKLGCPVYLLSQMNRGIEGVERPPRLSDLRDSGDLEQDADTVIFPYRPNPDDPECEIIVGKYRHGPPGSVKVQWIGHFTRFADAL